MRSLRGGPDGEVVIVGSERGGSVVLEVHETEAFAVEVR
jgi:hypothetical protein